MIFFPSLLSFFFQTKLINETVNPILVVWMSCITRYTVPYNAKHSRKVHGTYRCKETCHTPCRSEEFQTRKMCMENAGSFAYDAYEGFQRKEQKLAVAIDLEDAYNWLRAQCKLLMDLHVPTKKKNWNQTDTKTVDYSCNSGKNSSLAIGPLFPTLGILQGSPLSPIIYDVYTKYLADLNQMGSGGYSHW